MKKGLSFLIILVLIATGIGFTSPESQNKEIDFSNEIKYIDGVVDLDFSEEGIFVKSEEVKVDLKNFVINKAQIRIIGDVDYGGESYKLNIKGKMGKSNTEEGVIGKVEDLSGNFEVIHLSFISVSTDLQSILQERTLSEKKF